MLPQNELQKLQEYFVYFKAFAGKGCGKRAAAPPKINEKGRPKLKIDTLFL